MAYSSVARSGIYEIFNTRTGKRYIGSAVCMPRRFTEHLKRLRRGDHQNRKLQNAWNKYGEAAFIVRPLVICAPRECLQYEQRAIDRYAPEYNICKVAGSCLGTKRTPEQIAKMANSKRGVPLSAEHRQKLSDAFKGRTFSEQHLAKIAAAWRNKRAEGWKRSPESLALWSEKMKGRKPSDEARRKMSAARKGRPSLLRGRKQSEETKEKIRQHWLTHANPWKGRNHSAETIAKLTGQVRSAETRAKISDSKKGRKMPAWAVAKLSERMLAAPPFKGKHHSEETKAKLSARIISNETRAKMRESQSRRGPTLESTREKMRAAHAGVKNAAAIKETFSVQNADGTIRSGIPIQLREWTGLSPPQISQLLSGKQKTAKGWRLVA